MGVVRKVTFKLANPHPGVNARYGRSIAEIVRLMDDHNAPEAEVTLSMGRRRGSLRIRNVVSTAQRLLAGRREHGDEVVKITATGAEHGEEHTLVLDLIRDRITEEDTVSVGANRRLSDTECAHALMEAYEKRSQEISELYGG
jgi:hypothetical protein